MESPDRTTVTPNAREQRMISEHMRDNPGIWDTPSDWVHDAVKVFHVVLRSKAMEALLHRALKEPSRP